MADMENGILMNGENGNDGAQQTKKDEGFIQKTVKAVRTGYIRIRATKGGRVVIGGTKLALMGLGLWKGAELISDGKKKAEEKAPVVVVITPENQAESAPAEEEPAAEEANETVAEQTNE